MADPKEETSRCRICNAQATGFHFEAQSCSACAAFFRRTVALNKSFECITGRSDCHVHYTMHQICRSCRYMKCSDAGMNRSGVQPRRIAAENRRSFFTKSGLKRNKKFAVVSPLNEEEIVTTEEQLHGVGPSSISSISTSRTHSPEIKPEKRPPSTPMPDESNNPSTVIRNPITPLPREIHLRNSTDALDILIREEMRLGERRRIMFCERPVEKLLGQNPHCPFTKDDIRPLSFRTFRKSIRTHILLIYEWLQAWPDYATLDNADKTSFLRKCILFHTILDPVYISIQIGYPDKFVMQNGGFVSCREDCDDGWADEKEISGQVKKMIYRPLLDRIMTEIIPPLMQIDITFVEFVALKAFVSFQGAIENVSPDGRAALKRQLDAIINSLHRHYIQNGVPAAERLGTIILLLSSIFSTGLEFVESHRQIEFFDLWQLDSLLLQFLNLDAIMQRSTHEDS